MTVAENCLPGSASGLPVPGKAAAGAFQEGWWQRTRRIYAQEWKIKDTSFTPQPAMLGIAAATAALAANLMGLGVATMPLAFAGIGWSAVLLIGIFGALSVFNSFLLGWCCDILEERHEEFRKFYWYTHYTDIASKALGDWGGSIVVALRLLSVVGLQAVLLVTMAEFGGDFAGMLPINPEIQGILYCTGLTFMGILSIVIPTTSTTRYWANIVSLPFNLVLVVLLIAGLSSSRTKPTLGASSSSANPRAIFTLNLGQLLGLREVPPVSNVSGGWAEPISGTSFFASLGILAFNFANIAGFPLVRRDIKAPAAFNQAVAGSIIGHTFACLVVGVAGYGTFGALVNGNIVLSLDTVGVRLAANFILAVVSASTMTLIYTTLDEHESFNDYGKRCDCGRLKRIFPLMLVAYLLALAVPFKGLLVALVGALAVCPVIYVLPPIFYFQLCKKSDQWSKK